MLTAPPARGPAPGSGQARSRADALHFAAPLLAAALVGNAGGSVEVVSVLAVAPPLAATLAQKRGAIPALFLTALTWIFASLAFLQWWPICFLAPSSSTPAAMAAAWWAPFAVGSVLLRSARRPTRIVFAETALSVAVFALLLVAGFVVGVDVVGPSGTVPIRIALLVVAALAFADWITAAGFLYVRDPLASLWWPALPISIVFTGVELVACTDDAHKAIAHAVHSIDALDRLLDPPLACYAHACWSMWDDIPALLVALSGTATAAAAVSIAVARARGPSWPSLVALLPLSAFPAVVAQRYFADFGGSLPVPLQLAIDVGAFTMKHAALLTAGVTLPIAALAARRALAGVTPTRSLVAVGVLGAGAIAASFASSSAAAHLAAVAVSTTIAWIALEPPRVIEQISGSAFRRRRARSG